MRSLKSLLVLCLAVLVVGCATQRPAMTEYDYQSYARSTAIAIHCYEAGVFDADTTASARTMINNRINQYTYDQNYMMQIAKGISKEYALGHCREAAVLIAAYRQQVAANQRQSQPAPQPTYTQPARTICNNIAGQILCSTY